MHQSRPKYSAPADRDAVIANCAETYSDACRSPSTCKSADACRPDADVRVDREREPRFGPRRRFMGGRLVLAGCLSFLVAACTPAPTSAPPADAQAQPDATAATACPTGTFEEFLDRFGHDLAFQKATTADPLTVERYDTAAEPEPRLVTGRVAQSEIAWPVMPRLDTLAAQGRIHEIAPTAEGRREVLIRRQDTSDQQTYIFEQVPCWQLQGVIDESV